MNALIIWLLIGIVNLARIMWKSRKHGGFDANIERLMDKHSVSGFLSPGLIKTVLVTFAVLCWPWSVMEVNNKPAKAGGFVE